MVYIFVWSDANPPFCDFVECSHLFGIPLLASRSSQSDPKLPASVPKELVRSVLETEVDKDYATRLISLERRIKYLSSDEDVANVRT